MDLRYEYGREGDIGVGIHRGTLFSALYEEVVAAGIEILTSSEVISVSDGDEPVVAHPKDVKVEQNPEGKKLSITYRWK